MPRKTFAERADDSVRWTGVPRLIESLEKNDDRQRRRLRWWPIAALALAAVGSWLMLADRVPFVGTVLYAFGLLVSVLLPTFGPVKLWGSLTADEYDRDLRRSALLFAYVSCTMFAAAAFLLLSYWRLLDVDDRKIGQVLSLSIGWLLILQGAMPTLWASWRTAPPPRD